MNKRQIIGITIGSILTASYLVTISSRQAQRRWNYNEAVRHASDKLNDRELRQACEEYADQISALVNDPGAIFNPFTRDPEKPYEPAIRLIKSNP